MALTLPGPSRRLLLLAPLTLLLLHLPGTGPKVEAGSAAAPRLVAGALCMKGESPANAARVEVSGIAFVARPVATAEWEGRLERQSAGMGAALRPHDGSSSPYQVFLLSIENRSRQVLRFQPGNTVRILGNSKQQDHPVDYTDLYRYLTAQDKNPDSLETIRSAFFDSGLALEPGDRVERLLLFKEPPEKPRWKRLILLFSNFQVGTETFRADLSWHVEKEKK